MADTQPPDLQDLGFVPETPAVVTPPAATAPQSVPTDLGFVPDQTAPTAKPAESSPSLPSVALKSAVGSTQNMVANILDAGNVLTRLLPGGGPKTGGVSFGDVFHEQANIRRDIAQDYDVEAMANLDNVHSVRDFANYATAKVSALLPYLAAGFIAGPAEGVGAVASILRGSIPFVADSVGATYNQLKNETGEDHPGLAVGFGAAKGILMSLPVSRFVGGLFKTGENELLAPVWQTLMKDTLTHSASFAGINVASSTLDLIARKVADDTFDLANPKNWQGVAAAAMDGMITGGLLGVLGAPVKTLTVMGAKRAANEQAANSVALAQQQVYERRQVMAAKWLKTQAEKDAFKAGQDAAADAAGATTEDSPAIQPTPKPEQPALDTRPMTGTTPGPEGLPPVPEGHIRMYHGGVPGEGPRDVTQHYLYAKGYADKSKGGAVQYMDVPENHPMLTKAFDDTDLPQRAPYNNTVAPADVMARAKVVPKPKTPKSSTQLTLPPAQAQPFQQFAASIPDSEVYHKLDEHGKEDFGIETEPHITALYGLTNHDPNSAGPVVAQHGPITVTLGKMSVFKNKDYDVLKVDVDSPQLHKLNGDLQKLPNEQTFPDYHPHLTLAYLKKGEGDKYVGDTRFEGQKLTFNSVTFSPPKEISQAIGRPELPFKSPHKPARDVIHSIGEIEPLEKPAPPGTYETPAAYSKGDIVGLKSGGEGTIVRKLGKNWFVRTTDGETKKMAEDQFLGRSPSPESAPTTLSPSAEKWLASKSAQESARAIGVRQAGSRLDSGTAGDIAVNKMAELAPSMGEGDTEPKGWKTAVKNAVEDEVRKAQAQKRGAGKVESLEQKVEDTGNAPAVPSVEKQPVDKILDDLLQSRDITRKEHDYMVAVNNGEATRHVNNFGITPKDHDALMRRMLRMIHPDEVGSFIDRFDGGWNQKDMPAPLLDWLGRDIKSKSDFLKFLKELDPYDPRTAKLTRRLVQVLPDKWFRSFTTVPSLGGRYDIVNGSFNQLLRIARAAINHEAPDKIVHEIYHGITTGLTTDERTAIEVLRKAAIDRDPSIPTEAKEILKNGIASRDFADSGLPISAYHLANGDEFFVHEMIAALQRRPTSLPEKLVYYAREMFNAIVNAVKEFLGKDVAESPEWSSYFDFLHRRFESGYFDPATNRGLIDARNEDVQSRVASSKELADREFYGERHESLAAKAAYGDFNRIFEESAAKLGVSDRVRKLLGLDAAQDIINAADPVASGINNFREAWDAVKTGSEGAKTKVILYALDTILGVQSDRLKAVRDRDALQTEITGPKGWQRLQHLATLESRKDKWADAANDFEQRVSASAGKIMDEIKSMDKTSAAYTQAVEDYRAVREMAQWSSAVAQHVESMVDALASTPEGLDALFIRGMGDPADISRIYSDIRRSTGGPIDRREQTLINLASGVIASDRDLRLRLTSLRLAKDNAFSEKMDRFGAQVRNLMKSDPTKAMQFILDRMRAKQDKATRAETAWMAQHQSMMADFQRLADLQDLAAVHQAAADHDDWKQFVTEVGRLSSPDARSYIRPDVVVAKDGNKLYDEFTSKQQLVSPNGTVYDLDFGLDKPTADAAWRGVGKYIAEVGQWLFNQDALPPGSRSPEYDYWKRQRDYATALYYTDRLINPVAINSMVAIWKRSLMLQPDVELQRISLPGAKLAATALNNLVSSKMKTDGWYKEWRPQVTNRLSKAALDRKMTGEEYQDRILTPMAWLAGNGERLNPGVELHNGEVVTKTDIDALKMQARAINQLETMVRNVGREQLMTGGVLEHRPNDIWVLRKPMERGFEANTTLPRVFSENGRTLATLIHGTDDPDRIEEILDQPNFRPFMQAFVAQRKASFVGTRSPFEASYKEIAKLIQANDPRAPKTFDKYVDFILNHASSPDWPDADSIRSQMIGEIKSRMDRFYESQLNENPIDDSSFFKTSKDGALTVGRDEDTENSFFYDYGVMNDQQLRGLALNANNIHFARLDISLRSLLKDIDTAITAMHAAPDKDKFLKEQRERFRSGQDFRDYDSMLRWRRVVNDLVQILPKAAGDLGPEGDLVRSLSGPTALFVRLAMSGVRTGFRILTGSAAKQGLMFSAMDKGLTIATGKAMGQMAMAAFRVGIPAAVGSLRALPDTVKATAGLVKSIAARDNPRLAAAKFFETALQHLGDEMTAPTEELRLMRDLGLVPDIHLNEEVANRILMAETGGTGMPDEWPSDSPIKSLKLAGQMMLQGALGFTDFMSRYMPGVAYNIAYQAAAKQALNTIGVLESNLRKSFYIMEKTGKLGLLDLKNPGNPANRDLLHADLLLPRNLVPIPKMQSHLDITRTWFDHIDLPFTTAALNFWKVLQATPEADRKNVHLLSSDLATGTPEAKDMENKRAAVLAATALENIHHASIGNRPWRLTGSPLLRWFNPFLGWTTQTVNQWLTNVTGMSPKDPRYSRLATAGILAAGMAAYATVSATTGYTAETLMQIVADWINHEESGQKLPWIGDKEPFARDKTELAKTLLSAQFFQVPGIASIANMLLGIQSGRGGMNAESFLIGQFHNLIGLASGMIATQDAEYGWRAAIARIAPITKPLVNSMDSQVGLAAGNRASRLVQANIDPSLEREQSGFFPSKKTPLSPVIEEMANAAFKGDTQAFQEAQQRAVQVARDLGLPNPEKSVQQAFAARDPLSSALSAKPTREQYQAFLDRLTSDDRQFFESTYGNYQQAAQSIGVNHQPFYGGGAPAAAASSAVASTVPQGTPGLPAATTSGAGPTGTGTGVRGASRGTRGVPGVHGLHVGGRKVRGLRLHSATVGTRGLPSRRRGIRFRA